MRPRTKWRLNRRTTSLFGLAVLLLPAGVLAAGEGLLSEQDFKIPLWDCSADLRGGFGYKDNVLLSHTNAHGSAFWMSGAEFMAFRLPTHGWLFHFFADASDFRYFDSPSVGNEQTALAAAQLSKDFGHGWKSFAGLNYLFQNQVFDFSLVYTNQASVGPILGHTLAPRWGVRKTIGACWLEGELNATRQWLDEPLDNYWQFGPRAVLGYGWGRGSELALSYQYSRLDYDTREQVDSLGVALANTSLALNTHAVELALTHFWDAKRRWQTVTRLGFEASRDNGSGYYDFDGVRLAQQIRYRDESWEIIVRVRVNHFEFLTQAVSPSDTALRRKTMLSVAVQAERKLAKHLKAQASYAWDRSLSNLDFDDYAANTVVGGLALTF